jgi:hypothetical protein
MHHVAGPWNPVKLALGNVPVKSVRLLVNVNQSIFLARDDADGHLQVRVLILKVEGARNHES